MTTTVCSRLGVSGGHRSGHPAVVRLRRCVRTFPDAQFDPRHFSSVIVVYRMTFTGTPTRTRVEVTGCDLFTFATQIAIKTRIAKSSDTLIAR